MLPNQPLNPLSGFGEYGRRHQNILDGLNNRVVRLKPKFFVVFESVERAERFVTAFVHATRLCGGKPSDFPRAPRTPTSTPEK
jgi:hypothetical protein